MDFVKFPRTGEAAAFAKELRKEVKAYFKQNNLTRYGNANMVFKTIFMVMLYIVPFILMITGVVSGTAGVIGMYLLMALGMSGIGLAVMHDANHGAYSKHKWVNRLLGNLINLAGGSAINWRLQHNVLHHSFTNIHGLDQDINIGKLMRFSPHTKRLKAHNYQHLYAWFFYSLMTIYWVIGKDFKDILVYKKANILKKEVRSFGWAIFRISLTKVLYFFVVLALPIWVLDVPAFTVIAGFVLMHLLAGLILSLVFQPAHVTEAMAFPEPGPDHLMKDIMAVHQLRTTSNFAMHAKWLTWLIGGLNYQVEHHLFPNICHIHYPKIAEIVRRTAQKYGLPYHSQPSFAKALAAHVRMLRRLGRQDYIPLPG